MLRIVLRILRRINSSEPPSPPSDTCPPGPLPPCVQFPLPSTRKIGETKSKFTTRKKHTTTCTIEPYRRRKSPAKTLPTARQVLLEAPPPLLAAPARPSCSTASHRWKRRHPPMAAPPLRLATPPPASATPLPPLAAAAIGLYSSGDRRLQHHRLQ
jgi:hypothetical protein